MLFVGIDVAKHHHDLAVLSSEGEILLKHLRFDNNRARFELAHQALQKFISGGCQVALEDTGHYVLNLIAFLRKSGYPVFSYNPLLIKEFVRSQSLRKTKTDKKDALSIARKLFTDDKPERFQADKRQDELKWLTHHRFELVQVRSKQKQHYIKVLDILFPELAKILNPHNQCVYDLLKAYPSTPALSRAHLSTLMNLKHLKVEQAQKIHRAAKQSIGQTSLALPLSWWIILK